MLLSINDAFFQAAQRQSVMPLTFTSPVKLEARKLRPVLTRRVLPDECTDKHLEAVETLMDSIFCEEEVDFLYDAEFVLQRLLAIGTHHNS